MNLSAITSTDLKRLSKLVEQKEALLASLAQLDAELNSFGSGSVRAAASAASASAPAPAPVRRASPGRPRGSGKRGPRGALKEQIVGLLEAAGKEGVTVKEVAAKLGVKPQNIHVWFSSTGRKLKEIKRIAPGQFAWVG